MDKKMYNLFFFPSKVAMKEFKYLTIYKHWPETLQCTGNNVHTSTLSHIHVREVPLVFLLQDWFRVLATCCSYSNSPHILLKWVTLVMPHRNNCNPSPHSKTGANMSNMSHTEDLWCCPCKTSPLTSLPSLHSKSSQTDPSKVVIADWFKNSLHIDHRALWFKEQHTMTTVHSGSKNSLHSDHRALWF